jgi:ferredoxin
MAMTDSFESALQGRVDAMIDACTRCGKCVEVCPATEPAGLSAEQLQNPAEVIGGVIDLLRGGAGSDAARKWASGCLFSGECIKACDYGVNPRFLLGMTRVAMAKAEDDAATRRRAGVEGFRAVARDVNALSRLQLDDALLARLGQKQNAAGGLPDFVFYSRHLDRLRPLLRERVPMRIALHRHPGVHGVVEAAEEILCAVPGIEIVDLQQPAVALRRASFRPRGQRHLGELHLARRAPR